MTNGWNIGGDGAGAWTFDRPGDWVRGNVVDLAEQQRTDPKDNSPMTWPNGDPQMQYRITLANCEGVSGGMNLNPRANDPNDDGKRAIYLHGSRKPYDDGKSALCAVMDAVREATGGTEIQPNAEITQQYTHDGQATQRGFTAPKRWAAWYKAPTMQLAQPGQQPDQATQQQPPAQPQQPPAQQYQQQPNPGPGGLGQFAPQGQPQQTYQQPGGAPNQVTTQQLPAQQQQAAPPTQQPGGDVWPPAGTQGPPPGWAGVDQPAQQQPAQQQQTQAVAAGNDIRTKPLTSAEVAGIQALNMNPADVWGPDWQQRVVG